MTRRTSISVLTAAILAACMAKCSLAAVTVELRERASVAPASLLCIKDIAEVSGDPARARRVGDITLATAPVAGSERAIQSDYVRLKIKAANLLAGTVISGAKQTIVSGRSTSVSSEQLAEEAKACLVSLLPHDGRVYDVTVERAPKDLVVNGSGDITISTKLLALAARPGTNSVSVEVVSGGKTVGRTTCTLRVKALADVVVATAQIRQGDAVTSENTRVEKREVGALTTSHTVAALLAFDQLVAKRTIAVGSLLSSNDVQSPPIIRRGDTVTVLVHCGAVTLTTTATAKQDAWKGDVVAVRPDVSSSDLRGTVSQQGIVELFR